MCSNWSPLSKEQDADAGAWAEARLPDRGEIVYLHSAQYWEQCQRNPNRQRARRTIACSFGELEQDLASIRKIPPRKKPFSLRYLVLRVFKIPSTISIDENQWTNESPTSRHGKQFRSVHTTLTFRKCGTDEMPTHNCGRKYLEYPYVNNICLTDI
jgi:hypothetical protein